MNTPWRMVVVDDDSKVRLLLERAFRAPEFETHAFPTGAAALRRVAEIRPDCVVSDILMPDMDGENLLRAVRAVPGLERVPFIAVSAVRSEARIRTVLEAGADAFLLKPFPLRDLIEKVRSLVERPATARSGGERTSDYTSPTRPVVAVAHTTSTAAIRRRPAAARFAPPRTRRSSPPAAPPAVGHVPPAPSARRACRDRRRRPPAARRARHAAGAAADGRADLGPCRAGAHRRADAGRRARGRSPDRARPAGRRPRLRPLHPGRVARPLVRRPDGGRRPAEVHRHHRDHREGRPAAEDRVRAPPPAGPRGGRRHRPPAARPAARRHAAAARRPRSRPHAAPRGVVGPEPQRRGRRPGVGHVGRRAARRDGGRDGRDGAAAAPDPRERPRRGGCAARLPRHAVRAGHGRPRVLGPAPAARGAGDRRAGAARSRPRSSRPSRTGSSSPCARPPGDTRSSSSGWASTTGWRAGRRREREPAREAGRARPRGAGRPADPPLRVPARVRGGGRPHSRARAPSPGRSSTSARPRGSSAASSARACVPSAGTSDCAGSVWWAPGAGREAPPWRSAWPGRWLATTVAASCSSISTCVARPSKRSSASTRRRSGCAGTSTEGARSRCCGARGRRASGCSRPARGRPRRRRRSPRRGSRPSSGRPTACSTTWSRTVRRSSKEGTRPCCRDISTASSSWCARDTPSARPSGGRPRCSGRA